MKAWDYIRPHRLALNFALRKSSQKFREEIDRYQIEYDRKVKEIEKELEATENSVNSKLETARDSLCQELNIENERLSVFRDNVLLYIEKYQYHLLNKQLVKIHKSKIALLCENNNFLSEQIDLIDEEVTILNERIRQLTILVDVSDTMKLANENGYNLGWCEETDAKALLELISVRIGTVDDKYERQALLRLKRIIQEQSDYQATINYMKWIVISKKKLKRDLISILKNNRDEIYQIKKVLTKQYEEYVSFETDMQSLAEQIRLYWAKEITFINVEICYLKSQQRELRGENSFLCEKHKRACAEHKMLSEISPDDRQQLNDLKNDIDIMAIKIDRLQLSLDQISSDIKKQIEKAKYWKNLRDFTYSLCKKSRAQLISDKNDKYSDEEKVLNNRLDELKKIRFDGISDAKNECERKKLLLTEEHKRVIVDIDSEKECLDQQLKTINIEKDRLTSKLRESISIYENLKKNDNRGFISKLLGINTPEIARAVAVITMDKKALDSACRERESIIKQISICKQKLIDEEESYTSAFENCQPIVLRPTVEEEEEEKKLKIRLTEIDMRKHEESDEN